MKRILLTVGSLLIYILSIAQNVGIGTTTPIARLHVADSNVLFTGPATLPASPANTPASGAGTRMMWYPGKAAFRVGNVDGAYWDKDSIGVSSFASGFNTKAKGIYSTSIGNYSTAIGLSAVSIGNGSNAIGDGSTSFGNQTTASGLVATSMGSMTIASGDFATSFGDRSIASGNYSISAGYQTKSSGIATTSLGDRTMASGFGATSLGNRTRAKSDYSLTIGLFNDTTIANSLFEIGNGTADNARKNAMNVLINGNIGIGVNTPVARLHVDSNVLFTGRYPLPASPGNIPVSGAGTRMMWYPDKAAFRVGNVEAAYWDKDSIGVSSFASGFNTKAKGIYSTSMGDYSTASGYASVSIGNGANATGDGSTSFGNQTTASGIVATSMGSQTIASGDFSTSLGDRSIASGNYTISAGYQTRSSGIATTSLGDRTLASGYSATSMGYQTKAKSNYSLVSGQFNDTTNTNTLFEIGNGTADNARHNAMTILTNGNVGIGTTTSNALLQLANTTVNRKLVLYDLNNNDHQYYGFGINGGILRYQVDAIAAAHVFYAGTSSSASNELFRINGNGNAVLMGTLTQTSDVRLKINIHRLQNPIRQLMKLNGYTYNWKDNYRDQELQIGLLAQEVEKVYPQLVKENEKGELSVNYISLMPVLLEAIKEQQKQIDEQGRLIELLLKKIK
ncbi:MAG: tail fiber domain-containing protein [Chitinophagaceae bacterium]|nr:tail fiber domain-containing protein [Chitinophagaceae bacterium]